MLGNLLRTPRPDISIAVIGDICLDLYYFESGKNCTLSVETGLPVNIVSSFKHEAGGAANIAVNIKKLGVKKVDLYGVLGEDFFGKSLLPVLDDCGVDSFHIQFQKGSWTTDVYHKIIKDGVETPRHDLGSNNIIDKKTADLLLDDFEKQMPGYNGVIINQQVLTGFQDGYFQERMRKIIDRYSEDIFWICDCRDLSDSYDGAIRKMNIDEASAVYRSYKKGEAEDRSMVKWLSAHWNRPLVVTIGENGAFTAEPGEEVLHVPGRNIPGETDIVGAGDAFLSALSIASLNGMDLYKAAEIANSAAAVSITKLYETGHPSLDEVNSLIISGDLRYNFESALNIRKQVFFNKSDIEIIEGSWKKGIPRIAIFDHDGTISTIRQGWEPLMHDVMIHAVAGAELPNLSKSEYQLLDREVDKLISKTTGIQTIVQMLYLQDMVKRKGYVPSPEILSPREYKALYNKKLMKLISGRIDLFCNNHLSIDDLTIKGAVDFLNVLKNNGVSLYLASGTDEDDLKREAELLGYADLFDGGIFGSVGDIDRDPKRIVVERIINSVPAGVSPGDICIFGDGPVEMQEGARNGLLRVGLVSDERKRFGINPDKRSRLILGGAQVLIPDFSWADELSELLGWGI